ncbi:hypothetical protein IHE45_17G094900 [Dioscorea alata]|uniref:Uncharacterized protein n=1 Tax=Dioscorea alata TaxID=55571 RepID=A0ACB7UE68_DIOAL|nr:hypothetical protein IHE45_17G094900 [Dioscorea alata]
MASPAIDNGDKSDSAKKKKKVTETPKNANQESMMKSKEPVSEEVEEEEEELSRRILVRIEADVLNCSSCYEALFPPIYQCPNSHVMCSLCFVKHTGKCPSCSEINRLTQCLALERIIESMEISCSNAGCDETVSYLYRASHQESCIYAQCFCPFCSFQGCMTSLAQHVADIHKRSAAKFSYESSFQTFVYIQDFSLFISPDNRLFLLLINRDVAGGTGLSVISICPTAEDFEFTYDLSVDNNGTYFKMTSGGEMIRQWTCVHPKTFLFVPDVVCHPRKIFVCVTIRKSNRHT